MELRQYRIHIFKRHPDVQFPPDLLADFGCCISAPSGFVLRGTTNQRGLAYTDQNGNGIQHPFFVHLALFPDKVGDENEADEIREEVSSKIAIETHLNKYHDFDVGITHVKTEIYH